MPKDCALLVGAVEDEVKPEIVKLDDAPQVAKGIQGASVVAPDTLYDEPFANTRLAVEPVTLPFVEILVVAVLLITPLLETVTTVPVPPVVIKELAELAVELVPETVKVPAIVPVIPAPVEKIIEIVFVVLVSRIELPDPMLNSSPTDPVKVRTLWVAALD